MKLLKTAAGCPSLPGPPIAVPDFVIHPDDHAKASWTNALIMVEIEACIPNDSKEGFGQALCYLA
jgi:hypothetical protein